MQMPMVKARPKRNGAAGEVVAVGADTEEDEQEGEHDGGVADEKAFVAMVEVGEEGDGGCTSGRRK